MVSFRARFSVGANGHGHGHVRNKRNSFRKQYNNVYNWAIDWKRIDDIISLSLTLFLYENLDIDPHHIDSLLMDFSLFHLLWVLGFLCVCGFLIISFKYLFGLFFLCYFKYIKCVWIVRDTFTIVFFIFNWSILGWGILVDEHELTTRKNLLHRIAMKCSMKRNIIAWANNENKTQMVNVHRLKYAQLTSIH